METNRTPTWHGHNGDFKVVVDGATVKTTTLMQAITTGRKLRKVHGKDAVKVLAFDDSNIKF